MLRTWNRWIAYPLVLLAVLVIATIPHWIARSNQANAPTNQFTITHFTGDYVLEQQPDGTTDVLVTERIEAFFPAAGTNRGIVRAIPLHYQDHTNTLTELTVTGDVRTRSPRSGRGEESDAAGAPQPFTRTETKGVVLLRIGDANRSLQRGRQVWEIRYRLGDVALNTPDLRAQEIYLDANGSGWEVPFNRVTANLHVPGELAARLNGNAACYWGPEGATNTCQVTTRTNGGGTVVTGTVQNLDRRSGLTLAVGFENGTFPVAYTPTREPWPWWLFVLPAIGLVFYLVSLIRYLRARGLGKPQVLVTEYSPPKGVPALAAADIIGRPEKGPTAQLLEFAEAGVLHLETSHPPEPRPDGPPTSLGFRARRRLRDSLRIPSEDFAAIEDETVREVLVGYFRYGFDAPHPEVTAELAEKQQELVVRGGWREWGPERPGWFGFTVFCFLVIGGIGMYAVHPRGQDFWWALLSGLIGMLLLIAALYRAPSIGPLTAEGRRVRDHLLGLRHFIRMSEANRIAWLQGVESSPVASADDHAGLIRIYEPLLPYAVIFGLEKSWTAVLGEHHRVVPATGQWLGALQSLPLGDVMRTLDHGSRHRGHRNAGGFRFISATNQSIGDGFRGFGEILGDGIAAMSEGRNDGGGSRWGGGGGGSSWRSGGSRGGGRSGGGMGGGGGGGW
ncbi:DUF2207 domain-containing protein [Granulicoccus sp. GXG6511]|uniref:DUF2207 domain-containing protein n=1 Tax=Granulicoccus sp. GXG6511 TaxID=3381351 RepID=UPI003D7D448C